MIQDGDFALLQAQQVQLEQNPLQHQTKRIVSMYLPHTGSALSHG